MTLPLYYALYSLVAAVVFVVAARIIHGHGCQCDECRTASIGMGFVLGVFWPFTVFCVVGVSLIMFLEWLILPRRQ